MAKQFRVGMFPKEMSCFGSQNELAFFHIFLQLLVWRKNKNIIFVCGWYEPSWYEALAHSMMLPLWSRDCLAGQERYTHPAQTGLRMYIC